MKDHADLQVTRNVDVPMRDGTLLRCDIYRPAADGPFPTLLQRTPYVKDFNPGIWVVLDPFKAAAAGFAVVIQDVRGRGASDGDFDPFVNEGADGIDSVEWITAQDWSDGRVALYGSSYMAAAQWQAAKAGAPHLFAIAPFQASSDYFEGRSYRGGALEIGALLGVSLNALGGGIAHRLIRRGELRPEAAKEARQAVDRISALATVKPIEQLRESVLGEIAPFFFQWASRTDPSDPYWQQLRVEGTYDAIDLPVLHLSSWYDQAHVGTLRNFEGMRRDSPAADRQYLLMGPWAHRVPRGTTLGQLKVGELYMGAEAIFDLDRLQLKWFRGVLDGGDREWPFSGRARLFVMGSNRWEEFSDWPPPEAVEQSWYLGAGDSSLSEEVPSRGEEIRFVHDPSHPVPTAGGAHMAPEALFAAGPVEQGAVQSRADVAVFTSEPLAAPLTVVGWVDVELWAAADGEADLAVTLSDVWPDGRAYNVCDGYLRVCDGPAEIEQHRVSLGATAHCFQPGHRLRVHVAGSSSPRHPVPGDGVVVQRIATGADHPSRLIVRRITSTR